MDTVITRGETKNEINQAKAQLSNGLIHGSSWSCGRIKQIKVGDQAYFYRVGTEPRGFFAYGRVVTTEIKQQSRLNWSGFEDLSEAYTDIYNDLRVTYNWYSVVDYNKPLQLKLLKNTKDFGKCNFFFRESGVSFNEQYVETLNTYWKQHVFEMSKQGYGVYTSPPT
jgi:predicted RNA-binding protein with PUA-like domain